MKFDNVELEFPDRGLVMVTGFNSASGGSLQSVGCHAAGQQILMADGMLKKVEDVKVGDLLLGPDAKPRTVLKLCRGRGRMYRIQPIHGKSWIVNENHVLALTLTPDQYVTDAGLVWTRRRNKHGSFIEPWKSETFTVTMHDFLTWSAHKKSSCKLYYAPSVEFLAHPDEPIIPPRILGLWLGDGNSGSAALTTADSCIADEWSAYGRSLGLHIRAEQQPGNASTTFYLSSKKGGNRRPNTRQNNRNPLLDALRNLNIYNNKHIPQNYKTAPALDRLKLLSGLLDTDGYYANKCFYFYSTNQSLAEDTAFIARSLGFCARIVSHVKKCQTGASALCHIVSIFGAIETIPTQIQRKKAELSRSNRRHNITGFSIVPVNEDDYYGFTLDKDGLYLLDDFTVTHNSGKTGVGEAISRALLGVPGRFPYVKQFSTDKKGDTYVRVDALLHEKPLVVEMGYKCEEMSKTGEALRFQYDGKTIERGLIAETRAELTRLIGVPPLLAMWTVFVDGENLKFNKLSQADSVELVMSALRQPPWNEYHEQSKRTVGKFKQILAKDEKAHEEAGRRARETEQDWLDAKEDVDREKKDYTRRKSENERLLQEGQAAISQKHTTINQCKLEQEKINKKLKEIEQRKSKDYHTLEIQRNEVAECIHELERHRQARLEKREKALEAQLEAKRQYQTYEASGKQKNCPTCGQPMTSKIDPARLETLKQKFHGADQQLRSARQEYDDNEEAIKAQTKQHTAIREKLDALSVEKEVTELSGTYEDLEDRIRDTLNLIHQSELRQEQLKHGVPDDKLKNAETTMRERERVLILARKTIETTATALAESQAAVKVLDYWNLAFSPYGIPNMVLKDAIHPLNREARRVSSAMTGGTIEIVYSTQRELASGQEKAQLVIEVNNALGSQELAGSSKGESGLTNLIIAETLAEVGQVSRRIGYRWYDEVVPHQDQVVCKSIYARLRQIAHSLGILIFIVDHNPAAADYADHLLVVEKCRKNGSVLSTAAWH